MGWKDHQLNFHWGTRILTCFSFSRFIFVSAGKEDEKRRYQKRYEELKYDKSLLDKRASILADQLQVRLCGRRYHM